MNPEDIAVAWNGLPAYGAHLIQAARDRVGFNFPVIATRPDVPIQGMEAILKDNLRWVEAGQRHSWGDMGLPVPRLFVHTGWSYLHFVSLADEVRWRGGKVIGMFDNSWKANLRQWLGAAYFRMFLRRKYVEAWVPGKSGCQLARRIGFSPRNIREGLYGAKPEVFHSDVAINDRPKQILFVGRLIDRKGILELIQAFVELREQNPDWRLIVIGEGPHSEAVLGQRGVELKPFSQPDVIVSEMNRSRVLALPSREEHWGLVVHEACLCGCSLLLTKAVGAGADLVGSVNGVRVPKTSVSHLKQALAHFYQRSAPEWALAQNESRHLAENFGPYRWADEVEDLLACYD